MVLTEGRFREAADRAQESIERETAEDSAVRDLIFPVQHASPIGLQTQLRRHLVDAILDGRLSTDEPLPSCRRLAKALGISRNTVVLAYQALLDEGMLISRERVGYFVNGDMVHQFHEPEEGPPEPVRRVKSVSWWEKLKVRASTQVQITKPKNWRQYPYPFIYGQTDPSLFDPNLAILKTGSQMIGTGLVPSVPVTNVRKTFRKTWQPPKRLIQTQWIRILTKTV